MKNILLYLSLTLLIGLLTTSSCTKKTPSEPVPADKTFGELVIDPNFTFENIKQIEANFTVVPFLKAEQMHIITIYQEEPGSGGRVLNRGITNNSYQYSISFKIPDRISSIYVENRSPDGLFEIVEIPLTSNIINHTFNTKELLYPPITYEKTVVVDPGCGSNCDETLSGTYTNLVLEKNKDYCVAEGTTLTITNQLQFAQNATIVICGNASISQIATVVNNTGKLYISSTGIVSTSGDLNIDSKIDIYNFGLYNISGNVNTKYGRKFYNYGNMNIAGSINNNSNKFNNEGIINLSGNYSGNINSRLYNYGTFTISGSMNVNNKAYIYNYCNLNITGNLMVDYRVFNYSYINVANNLIINGSSYVYVRNSSLIQTKNLTVNGRIQGQSSSYSKVMISEVTIINSSGQVRSRVDLCDADGIEINNGTIQNTVKFCEITIPADNCNPGSEGGTGDVDTDGDGVLDVDDAYPDDPERAFNNYYPNQTDFASLAFEDLWPGLGDYDFNDLVVDFNYQMVTNANNLIVDIIAQTHIKAAGAALNNGFGISFPIESSKCASATGFVNVMGTLDLNAKGYENGHIDNTVVIFYDAINTYYGSAIFNTVPGGNTVVTDTITVTVYFDDPQFAVGLEPYNPFIYVDQERGKEIHMIDHAPTSLASDTYFGTSHDNSDPLTGKWYLTENYLPWVVETPSSFDYPIEQIDILSAYLKFSPWAESSGAVYNDWYLDEPGYRNDDNIYEEE